jgi:hypothetical protein
LFPIAEHNHDGTALSSDVTNPDAPLVNQPIADPYISTVNNGLFFQVVDETTTDGYEDPATEAGASFRAIALQPRERDSWELPHSTSTPTASSGASLTDAAINEIDDNGTSVFIPFLDKGMYNGRQQMAVRVLNIDLDLLRSNTINSDTPDEESWLPDSGIVYAFREDALREEGIARPNGDTWANCNTEANLTDTSGTCFMNPEIPRDPPKQADNGVSPKPVDYIADPDRRPYGFRLSNGSQLGRDGTDCDLEQDGITCGLSFISDNPAYILGDFNLHSENEFNDSSKSFYQREDINKDFAKAATDDWRPTEVLADAITILSNAYCDGVIEDAIQGNNNGCDDGTSSYRDTKLKADSSNSWDRENEGDTDSPIALNRNGALLYGGGNTYGDADGDFLGLDDTQALNNSDETTVNSVIVSGLTPTRVGESYGGLHNFPRFNENWDDDLNINGSLVQLNFSAYDTASYDHENTFAPASSAGGGEFIPYYGAPGRNWGYDPALQYNPPGPIVERLLSQSGLRSELYQEIEVSDPYIQQLCRAIPGNSPTCPPDEE